MPVCFMGNKEESGCGDFRGSSDLKPLKECVQDISSHLSRCHLSKENNSEYQLILTRAGHFHLSEKKIDEMFVCPRHRETLGTYWKCSKNGLPLSKPQGKTRGSKIRPSFQCAARQRCFGRFQSNYSYWIS